MREIKFRGWHMFQTDGGIVYQGWEYGYYYNHFGTDRHSIYLSNGKGSRIIDKLTLGEFTGLKDIKGVDIYEDDIVRAIKRSTELSFTGVIKMPKSCWVLEMNQTFKRWYRTAEFSRLEVIGNIYENPELI